MNDMISTLYIVMAIVFVWLIIITLWLQHVAMQVIKEHNRVSKELCDIYDILNEHLHIMKRADIINELKRSDGPLGRVEH